MERIPVLSDAPVSRLRDQLQFSRYVDPLVSVLTSPDTETPFTIGIYGAWGSGKTSLLRMIDYRLNDLHTGQFVRVHFNPWVHRKEPTMLVPLLHALQDTLAEDTGRRFVETTKKLGAILTTLASDVIVKNLTANAVSLDRLEQLERAYVRARGQVESETRRLHQTLQHEASAISDKGAKLVFFIDDLDRCEPDEIIDLLESVKLFLDLENVFVFIAIAKDVVDRGVSVKYKDFKFADGAELAISDEYLDKMIQLPLYLLPIDPPNVGQFIRALEPGDGVLDHLDLLQGVMAPNPRRIKRIINLLSVTGAIAAATPGLAKLDQSLIVRLVVLRVQSGRLYADVVSNPALLSALELTYQGQLVANQPDLFLKRFGARGEALRKLTESHFGSQTYLRALFAESHFAAVSDEDLPAYLTMLGG